MRISTASRKFDVKFAAAGHEPIQADELQGITVSGPPCVAESCLGGRVLAAWGHGNIHDHWARWIHGQELQS